MCGITVMLGKKDKNTSSVLANFMHLNKLRGGHSAGLAIDPGDDNNVIVEKSGTTAPFFVLSDFVKRAVARSAESTSNFLAITHTRYATSGDRSIINAQPIIDSGRVLAHNGTIDNVFDLMDEMPGTNSDSKLTLEYLNKKGLDHIKDLDGDYAITHYYPKSKMLSLFRNTERPLKMISGTLHNEACLIITSEAALALGAIYRHIEHLCEPLGQAEAFEKHNKEFILKDICSVTPNFIYSFNLEKFLNNRATIANVISGLKTREYTPNPIVCPPRTVFTDATQIRNSHDLQEWIRHRNTALIENNTQKTRGLGQIKLSPSPEVTPKSEELWKRFGSKQLKKLFQFAMPDLSPKSIDCSTIVDLTNINGSEDSKLPCNLTLCENYINSELLVKLGKFKGMIQLPVFIFRRPMEFLGQFVKQSLRPISNHFAIKDILHTGRSADNRVKSSEFNCITLSPYLVDGNTGYSVINMNFSTHLCKVINTLDSVDIDAAFNTLTQADGMMLYALFNFDIMDFAETAGEPSLKHLDWSTVFREKAAYGIGSGGLHVSSLFTLTRKGHKPLVKFDEYVKLASNT